MGDLKSDRTKASIKATMNEDEVVQYIEQAVMDHRLPPGTKLKEVQLAQVFGVKRGTIRKILTRLAHSHLVEQLPNRGARVAKPTVKEGRDLFATRRVIEGAIVKNLTPNIDKSQVQQLRRQLDLELDAYVAGDTKKALALSVEFHQSLAKMNDNLLLEEYLDDIIRRTPLVILTHLNADPQNHCRNQEHEAIVDALETGDTKKAMRIMNQHLLHIENRIVNKPEKPRTDLFSLLLSE